MRHFLEAGALLLAALVSFPTLLAAQETRTITGQVTLEGAARVPAGVQVTVKGTNIGTLTNEQGNFSLPVPADATTLVFTYIGYKTQEVPIRDHVEVTLAEEAIGLEGLVVTALGVEREKKTLGYSVQEVRGEDLMAVPELNVVNSLQGEVAGVRITNAGPTGGSSRIVIRGASSITGNNQPLFIIDGVPVDNSSGRNSGYGGNDYGNTIQDLDAHNIESISVLKGPNAAALYGSRAANGAIVITTKSAKLGSTGLGISATSSVTFEQPLRLPDYQNLYGQGSAGEFQWVDGKGGGLWDFRDESWGPRLDGRPIDQFTGKQQPWVAHPDNIRSYFETGSTWNTNVAISRASQTSNVRLSVTKADVSGMAPGNTIDRTSVALKGGAAVSQKLQASASMNYLSQDTENRVGTGYGDDNPMQSFTWFGRQVDMDALRHYKCDGSEPTPCIEGGQYNWNYNYHNNPFWEQLKNTNADERDRLIGSVEANFQPNDWITVTGRVGRDWYRWHRKDDIAVHSQNDAGDGDFDESTQYRSETNMDLLVTATRQLTQDFLLDATVGGNARENKFMNSAVSVSALTVPDIYTIDNASIAPTASDNQSEKKVRSVYGSLSLNYKGYLNVDVTGRNDWSSTLPVDNRSFFYPSISTAFLFRDAFGIGGGFLSSGKLRASWTRVGNDTDPYQLTSVLNAQQPFGSAPMFSIPGDLPNATLKPEETTAWEIGTDLGFFDERLGFVLTYYNNRTRNQIMPVDISATSGYTRQILNAGEVLNKGLELLLVATPVRLDNGFRWDMTVNWSRNTSEVTELYGDLKTLVLGSLWSLNVEARKGEPYGVFFGNGYLEDDQGRWLLDSEGRPQIDPVRRILGNYNPDWVGGIQNRFTYGPLDLSVLLDGQKGGDVFSITNYFGTQSGVLARTLEGRENDWCDPGIAVKGVMPDGSINGDGTDDKTMCPQDYFYGWWSNQQTAVYDASYLKLRELRVGYRLPEGLVSRFGFSSADIAFIGRNLYMWTNTPNIDPETAFDASNVQGLESGQFPTARSFGFSVSIRP